MHQFRIEVVGHEAGVPIDGYPALVVGSGSMEVRGVGFRWDSMLRIAHDVALVCTSEVVGPIE